MLFANVFGGKAGCLSVGFIACLSFGYNGKKFSL